MKYTEVYTPDGQDNGWLKEQNFWFNPDHEHGFEIQDLDSLYPDKYFEVDHVKPDTITAYCEHVVNFYDKITGGPPSRIIEIGTAGGWFGEGFKKLDVSISGIEGSIVGYAKSQRRESYSQLVHRDLRRGIGYPFLGDKFDIALCTEVAEHIEPPFSAILVRDICRVSNLVWFSFEPPNTNPAHIHHPNEMPTKFWINLFDFYGYGCYMLPDYVFDQTEGRGRMIFYNKVMYAGNQFLQGQH